MPKLSNISALELRLTYIKLLKLKTSLLDEESDTEADEDSDVERAIEQAIDLVISLLESGLPEVTTDDLIKMNISSAGVIRLKDNFAERVLVTTSLGKNELWSSQNLHRHLQMLERLVPGKTKASCRVWIDAFFLRVSSMLPPDKRMVLNMDQIVPAMTISPSRFSPLAGYVDYTAVVASKRDAVEFLSYPELPVLMDMKPSFFVIEAKLPEFSGYVPQAVSDLYACGKLLQKRVLRAALTNGRNWIFLIIKFNGDYDGASYKQSAMLHWELQTTERPDGHPETYKSPDLIAAILSYWTENGSDDLANDDWFELE